MSPIAFPAGSGLSARPLRRARRPARATAGGPAASPREPATARRPASARSAAGVRRRRTPRARGRRRHHPKRDRTRRGIPLRGRSRYREGRRDRGGRSRTCGLPPMRPMTGPPAVTAAGRGGARVIMVADNLPKIAVRLMSRCGARQRVWAGKGLGSFPMPALTPAEISAIDAAHIWHPYSTIGAEAMPPVVAVGAQRRVADADRRRQARRGARRDEFVVDRDPRPRPPGARLRDRLPAGHG